MPKEIEQNVRALEIGKSVRKLRIQNGLTLQNVSDLTNLSKPLLSQIENDMAAPPIATLLKISGALGVDISYFFQRNSVPDRISVVRRNEQREDMRLMRGQEAKAGYRYESLAYSMPDKQMEPFIVEIEPRSEDELAFYNHRGEEFLYVLSGSMEFRGADRIIKLGPGD
ncbi:MAG TPA: XRE family transcriptional regulator, partial [Desulfomonilaceae bacterium]|nr:XRE family transcriptional regulator [Desulfomonilaceae bacterium]